MSKYILTHKAFRFNVDIIKAKEDKKGNFYVEGYASTSDLDRQGDIIIADALEGAAQDLVEVNNTVFFGHEYSLDCSVGRIEKASVDEIGLKVHIFVSSWAKELRTKLKEGVINKFSIGGRILKYSEISREQALAANLVDTSCPFETITLIEKLELFEVSFVGVPANPHAQVVGTFGKTLHDLYRAKKIKGGDKMEDQKKAKVEEKAETKKEEPKAKKVEEKKELKVADKKEDKIPKEKKPEVKKIEEKKEEKVEEKKPEEKVEDKKVEELPKKSNEASEKKEVKPEAKKEEPKKEVSEEEVKAQVKATEEEPKKEAEEPVTLSYGKEVQDKIMSLEKKIDELRKYITKSIDEFVDIAKAYVDKVEKIEVRTEKKSIVKKDEVPEKTNEETEEAIDKSFLNLIKGATDKE